MQRISLFSALRYARSFNQFLFEDEAVIGINQITDFACWKIVRYNLVFLNAWPGKEIGENPSKYRGLITVGIVFLMVFLSSIVTYLKIHSDTLSFYELGHMYITLFMSIVSTSRLIITSPLSTKYRSVTSTFITKIHLFYYKDVSDDAMETHKQVHLISHLFTIFLTWQMFAGFTLFNLIPMWNNYSAGKYKQKILINSTYEHSIYFYSPIDMYTHLNSYIVGCIFNWITSYMCSTWFCMLDLLLSLIIFNIWGHLKILLHDLDSFALPAKVYTSLNQRKTTITAEMYSEEELKQVSLKLKQCINHHRLILDFTNKISDAFGPMLLVYFVFHQVSGCLLLLECSQMTVEALLRYAPLSAIVFQQLIQLSIVFELIGSTSEKLKDAVYGVPWEYMDTKNRRTVLIFLMNVQTPIHVKALGVVDVGVTTMATILKTSLSYFTFLRSI